MGLVFIFALITILAAYGVFCSLKSKNFLAVFWGMATILVFGWFSIMTIIHHGVPTSTI